MKKGKKLILKKEKVVQLTNQEMGFVAGGNGKPNTTAENMLCEAFCGR